MTEPGTTRVDVPVLARVEGEGALHLRVTDGRLEDVRLAIYEPPRLFEQFLRGHHYGDVPDLVARICGICPVAYQMSAVAALERLFGADPGPWVRDMRHLFYCGEWVQSHALHVHLLAAPDYLGYETGLAMAADHPEAVRRGLAIQAAGNAVVALLGGRSVHPVGVRPGGFWHAPSPDAVAAVLAQVEQVLPQAAAVIDWVAGFELPDVTQDFVSVALAHPEHYPMMGEHIVSDDGLNISVDAFEQHVREGQVPHSTALHAWLHETPYLVGPLARLNLHADKLHPDARAAFERTGIALPSGNTYHGIVARAVEVYHALLTARELLADYREPRRASGPVSPKAGLAIGASEAPRGLLWHRYRIDEAGLVEDARIVPPTSQNQPRIEADLRHTLTRLGLDRPAEELRRIGEMVIRNYDPCISCATHFLRVAIERRCVS